MIAFYDTEAEADLLGSCLLHRSAIRAASEILLPSDFGLPNHAATFDAICALYRQGQPVDSKTVEDQLIATGTSWPEVQLDLLHLLSGVPSFTSAPRYAEIIARFSLRRRLAGEAAELTAAANDLSADPGEALDAARERLAEIDTPITGREPDDESFDEFLARANAKPNPWLVRGLIREGWRTVIVAPEGIGKTWLLRQFAVCCAYGIHPLRFDAGPIIPTLLLDLENPEDHIHASLDRLTTMTKRFVKDEPNGRLWHRPGGIDLRKRTDRAELENLIAKRRPKLLVAGPLYKMMSVKASESWEQAAREVQAVLDDWRARYGISLLLEDHAPGSSGGIRREMRPYGSSLWLRWPEIGLGLQPLDSGALEVTRWRGDRMPTDWPTELRRGDTYPWSGYWAEGMNEELI